jgi:hypothetical protein
MICRETIDWLAFPDCLSLLSALGKHEHQHLETSRSGTQMKIYLLLLACILPASLFGQDAISVTGAKVTEVGIYQAKVLTDQTNAAGVQLQGIDEFKLVRSTTNVPARIGVRFGFRYEILGTPANAPVMLTMVVKHPPIKNPATGKLETKDTYPLKSWIGKTYTSGSLDDESDLVTGPYTFEVWHEGKKLCEQSIQLVPDENKKDPKRPEAAR